jgi:hypothetical protein
VYARFLPTTSSPRDLFVTLLSQLRTLWHAIRPQAHLHDLFSVQQQLPGSHHARARGQGIVCVALDLPGPVRRSVCPVRSYFRVGPSRQSCGTSLPYSWIAKPRRKCCFSPARQSGGADLADPLRLTRAIIRRWSTARATT